MTIVSHFSVTAVVHADDHPASIVPAADRVRANRGKMGPGREVGTDMTAHDELPKAADWRGINHLALVTPDMDATTRFYAGVLDMPLVATLMAGPMRHYFFDMGHGNTVAFFEIADAETFRKGAGSPAPHPVQLDHISFNVEDEAALVALQERLTEAGTEVTRVVDHDIFRSIYFTDNNGIALEASYWVHGAPDGPPTYSGEMFTDPDPVPAVAELEAGRLESLPTTTLV